MNAEHWRKFIDSLEGEKGLPEEMHGWQFDIKLSELSGRLVDDPVFRSPLKLLQFGVYMIERCRRAESRQIPDLKEKVKELMRDAMDAERSADEFEILGGSASYTKHRDAFRALCEPEKDSKEVKP